MKTIELAFESFGTDGPALLILHGLFGSGRNWTGMGRRLAEHHRVWLPDLRNHGASGHSPEMDYPHLAADLLRLLDSLRIDSASVIGHSMGGKAAIWLALTEPARISRLVAVDIAPVRYEHGFDTILHGLRGLPLAEIRSRGQADEALSKFIPESGLRQFLLQNLVSENGRYRWRIDLGIIQQTIPVLLDFPPRNGLAPYPGDALFIGGSHSPYAVTEYREAITRICPKARIEMIQDAGHWVQVDQPQRFFRTVDTFLREPQKHQASRDA
ncbi:MAG: alpha/beta fold hydrolase [Methylococcaceae bacterium]|nr:alpha/beta fold hydrolase [Methylococcaceae bacterium]MCI0732626.1 alpha/beta fold hydrolase [Methylococcaceae bacterium]